MPGGVTPPVFPYPSPIHLTAKVRTDTYSLYPDGKNTISTAEANYNSSVSHSTDVGSYSGSPSSHGTLDQGGNGL